MAIDRLSSTSSLIAALRAEVSSRTERAARTDSAPAMPRRADSPPKVADLRRQLVELVRSVPAGDADALLALRPAVVRAVLLWEFGPALREHPDWQPMLETIVGTLASDDRQTHNFLALLEDLRR